MVIAEDLELCYINFERPRRYGKAVAGDKQKGEILSVRCPRCNRTFRKDWDYREGTHLKHTCECGQLLDWDVQVQSVGGNHLLGAPHDCDHHGVKRTGAIVPLP